MTRKDGRTPTQMRPVKVSRGYSKYPSGSCLIEFGDTRVLCTANIEEGVPMFLKNSGTGWVTAEYGMIPGSCKSRVARERANTSGRTHEIQRLIGRALRSVVDMTRLGERTIKIDCDVIQADGGTRTAAITGGFIALADALLSLRKQAVLPKIPLTDYVAAVSAGIKDGQAFLDLNFEEDSKADIDMNVVMLGSGQFVEIQGTAEGHPFSKDQLDALIGLAQKGLAELLAVQKSTLLDLKLPALP